jgi:hypothetical protein
MAVSHQQILEFLSANEGMSDADIAAAMDMYGVSTADMAAATGSNVADIQSRYDAVSSTPITSAFEDIPTPPTYGARAGVPTFTDEIVNTPTTQDDFLTAISAPVVSATPVTPVVADVIAPTAPVKPSDQDIVKFLTDNPAVSDTDIATIMRDTGLTPADIARATGANINNVTNRYAAVMDGEETPVIGAPAKAAPAATDTSAADKLKQQILGQNLTTKWQGEGFGSADANAADMARIMASIGITDINQFGLIDKPVQVEVREDGKGGYVDVRTGKPVDPSTVTAQVIGGEGSDTTVFVGQGTTQVYGNKATGQEVPNTYSERQTDNAWGGTFTGKGNTGYRVQFDKAGNPIFYTTGASSSDIADWGPILALASVIPSPLQPFAIAANAAISINNGDILGGIASLAGLAGFSDVAAGARIAKAVDSKDPFAIVTSIMNSPFAPNIGSTMLTDTISLKDASSAVNIVNSLDKGDYASALSAASSLTGSSDAKVAAAALRFIKAAETNNFAGMYTAATGFDSAVQAANKVTDKDIASQIANSVADANSAATAGTQLAALGTGTASDAGNGLTLSGAGGDTLTFPDLTSSSTILSDAALFNSGLGTLDTEDGDDLDLTGGSTDTGGGSTDTGGGSTDTGGGSTTVDTGGGSTTTTTTGTGDDLTTTTGTGDDLTTTTTTGTGDDLTTTTGTGDDDVNLLNVCGDGMVFNTATGQCEAVKDEGTVTVKSTKETCPVGTTLNPVTGECDADWNETGVDCAPGFHDDGTGFCVADTDDGTTTTTATDCPAGMVRDLTTGACVWPDEGCGDGFHLDATTGLCVADDDEIICPPGKVLNDEGTACVDETVIIGKKETCPIGTTLNPETGECDPVVVCATGYHDDGTGLCVPDEDKKETTECPTGMVRDLTTGECVWPKEECAPGFHDDGTGLCVADDDEIICPPGKVLNEAGTACIDKTIVTAKRDPCPTGTVYDEDLDACVPITTGCAPGFHDDGTGLCVPDEEECQDGYHKDESGACVPDDCPDGYVRNLATGVCEKAEESCPTGYERDEITGKCIPVIEIKDKKCDPGYVYDEDLKQCVAIKTEGCAPGFHDDGTGLCVPDDEECKDGFEKIGGECVPVCKEGYIRNLATGVCEKVDTKECPPGQVKDANGKCVPITKVTPPVTPPKKCPPGYVLVDGTCVLIPTFTPGTSSYTSEDKTDPIYAGGMEDFDLFATLEELLADKSDKTDKKKDNKKSKDKTKMATGGHLDDLLAEQMTVDDLLKLLR